MDQYNQNFSNNSQDSENKTSGFDPNSLNINQESKSPEVNSSRENTNQIKSENKSNELENSEPHRDCLINTKRNLIHSALIVIGVVILVVAALIGGYFLGKNQALKVKSKSTPSTMSKESLIVPRGAMILEQCTPGLGTQYILPKDIPNGPIYNVYKGQLIGIEYMITPGSLQAPNSPGDNLTLFKLPFRQVNLMYMAAHAGLMTNHYEIDFMLISQAYAKKITCNGASSSSSMTM